MRVREYAASDLERLKQLHANRDYELPSPDDHLMLIRECIEEMGHVRAAGLARLELNVTLLLDSEWATPEKRFEAVRQLQGVMQKKAAALGLDWAYAEANQKFGRRLEELGWIPARDRLYFLRIH